MKYWSAPTGERAQQFRAGRDGRGRGYLMQTLSPRSLVGDRSPLARTQESRKRTHSVPPVSKGTEARHSSEGSGRPRQSPYLCMGSQRGERKPPHLPSWGSSGNRSGTSPALPPLSPEPSRDRLPAEAGAACSGPTSLHHQALGYHGLCHGQCHHRPGPARPA